MQLTRQIPAELKPQLQAQQFRVLQTQVPILYAVLGINTAVLSFSVYKSVPPLLSLMVPGTFALLILLRVIVWLMRSRKEPTSTEIARYLRSTTRIAACVSLSLGIWGVALLGSEVGSQPFVPLFIAFGAIACTYCLASLPRAAFATIIFSTTPVVIMLLSSGVRLEVAAAINLLLIFVLILRLIVHQYDYVIDQVISHSQLRALGYSDPLTALPNRRAFIESLEAAIAAAKVDTTRLAVAMIDLDGFKAINDTYGHAAGDAVLVQAARRIQGACPQCLTVARLGGDEFAVLLTGLDSDAVVTDLGARFITEMNRPFEAVGSSLRLTASIGIAVHEPADAAATAIMARADIALYEVKRGGGEGALVFASSMSSRARRRVMIEQSLRETDPRPNIEVLYQPIFDAKTQAIKSFEALARWDHPQLGAINPLEFVGVAERTGTIAALSAQIFAIAIQAASAWEAPIGLSLNLSGVDLCRTDTPATIMRLCKHHNFDACRLEVEVTETSVLSDFDVARAQIDALRQSGIRVSLDDFGSGFASIAYLKEITFDRIKIDGELVADILVSSRARKLLQGILQLCSAVGVPTTAERVETEGQMAVLIGLGCDRLQGFLLGPPVNASEADLLTRSISKAA